MRGFDKEIILELESVSFGRMNSMGGFDDSGPNLEAIVILVSEAVFEVDADFARVFILPAELNVRNERFLDYPMCRSRDWWMATSVL